jgi:RNA polymerase sigma factor for flagellar operon FliA
MAQKKTPAASAKPGARPTKPLSAPSPKGGAALSKAAGVKPTGAPKGPPGKAQKVASTSKVAPRNSAPGKVAIGKAASGKVAPGKVAPGKVAPGKVAPAKAMPAERPGRAIAAMTTPTSKGKPTKLAATAPQPKKSAAQKLKSDAQAPKTADMSSAAPAKKQRTTPKADGAANASAPKMQAPKASAGKGASKAEPRKPAPGKSTPSKVGAAAAKSTPAPKVTPTAKGKPTSKSGAKSKQPEPIEPEEASAEEAVDENNLSESDAKEAEEFDPVLKLKIPEIEEPKVARVSIKPKNPDRPTLEELRQMPTEDIWGYYRRAATAAKRDEPYIQDMRNVLMELHLPLVKHIAERLLQTLPKSIELGDLESAGSFGLMDAIRGFDPDRGIKFKTYCTTRIRGSILDMLRSQDWVPRLVRLKASRIEKTLQRLQGEYGREPTHAELASALDMDHATLSEELSQSRAKAMFSLSERWDDRDDDSAGEKIEIVEDEKATDPVHELNRRDLMLHITKSLSHKERFIIEQYYDVGHTMREIGEMLALTESRVCQIHSNVMARLKDLLNPGSSNLET